MDWKTEHEAWVNQLPEQKKKLLEEAAIEVEKTRPAILRNQIEAAWGPIIHAFAAMNELGPNPGSELSHSEFEQKLTKVIRDYEEIYQQTLAELER